MNAVMIIIDDTCSCILYRSVHHQTQMSIVQYTGVHHQTQLFNILVNSIPVYSLMAVGE